MNQFNFLGRISQEPEIRNTQNGGIVYNVSIAVNRKYKKEGDEVTADFFKITAFGKTAEFMQKYMNMKGQQILVSGHIQNRNWEDEQGQKHYATDYIVNECYFADSKKQQNENNMTELQNHLDNAGVEFNTSDDLPF